MLDKDKKTITSDMEETKLWQLARKLGDHRPVILAGGLNPENVSQAIETARPYAVDVSSGVEIEPGKKDHNRLRAFISAAAGANPNDCSNQGQSYGIAPTSTNTSVGADPRVCPNSRQSRGTINM